ncbi:BrnT family toxin [Kamptonema sp. UHCC 0994]|uniref:BrnT family toxin n=1 Tax=Kamptonema sp. UHCC 0994 TaxID=3031329 RepID=UPI0023B8DB01|nr:BrnT family toxin [Kamptonema sp. UHCC 0994]MDF0552466.1 BrnT family toxin [Kamptonema sp. UHCC 0994]
MTTNFDWDNDKARTNQSKHGIDFDEAATIFDDPFLITIYDEIHSLEEDRYLTIGYSNKERLLVVAYTYRGDTIRIISARIPTKHERRSYEQGI